MELLRKSNWVNLLRSAAPAQWTFCVAQHLSLSGKIGDGWKPVAQHDMPIPFLASYAAGAAGVISWDCPGAFAPHYVGPCPANETKVACRVNATRQLILTEMGPMVKSMLAGVEACAAANCSGHGRCSLLPWPGTAAYYPPVAGAPPCVCDPGRTGLRCDNTVNVNMH